MASPEAVELTKDLRHAIRQLWRTPGFTLVAVLTLGLGIGANTAIFSVVRGVLLRPLPYPEPDRLVSLWSNYRGQSAQMDITYAHFGLLEREGRVFEGSAAAARLGFSVFTGSAAVRMDGLRVSRGYFRVLGVRPELGRALGADEDRPGGASAVVLSHRAWQRHFGGDRAVLGRTISVDGVPSTVVGVMPAAFQSFPAADLWSTVAQVGRTVGSGQNLTFIARLARQVPLGQARAGFQSTAAALRATFPDSVPADMAIDLVPYRQVIVDDVRAPLRILFGAIALVLLIACANVANLMLARATTRTRELGVRLALGATRARLVRQMLTESLVLAVAGGAVGVLLGAWGLSLLLALAPEGLTRASEVSLDGWVLAFTFALSLATGVIFGLVPAWRAAGSDPQVALQEGAVRATGSRRRGRLHGALVVAEVGLSLILLVGAGLLVATFGNLVRVDPGFDPARVVAAEIWLTGPRHRTTAEVAAFHRDVVQRIEALPGVVSAAVVESGLPLQRGGNFPIAIEGKFSGSNDYRTVTPGYFRTLGLPLREGRLLEEGDGAASEPVAVVTESFARRHFPDRRAVGAIIGFRNERRRIVGVVGDVRSFIGAPPRPTYFLTSAQTPIELTRLFAGWFPIHVLVRTTGGDPAALGDTVTRLIHATDAQVPVGRVRALGDVLSTSLAFHRFLMTLLAAFAGLAALLAAVGIYGVMSYSVTQRTREIGVRMALGAQPRDALALVIGRAMALTGAGALVGLAGAAVLTRLLERQLFGVTPTDPATFAGMTALLLLVALAASWLPARRATRVDPMLSLRSE
jgi:putative ABC transport system permease protein